MKTNFFLVYTLDGKHVGMVDSRPTGYYVEYRNNRPVTVNVPRGVDRVWDYSTNEAVAVCSGATNYATGKKLRPLPSGCVVLNRVG